MTGRAGWDFTLWIAGKNQANAGIALPQTAATLRKAFAAHLQSIRSTGEIRGDVGGILFVQGGSDGVHDPEKALARTEIVELFVDCRRIHAGESGKENGFAYPTLTMTGGATERNEGTVFLIAGIDPRQRRLGPGNSGGRSRWRLRLVCRPSVSPQADRATKRGPAAESRTILLESPQDEKPDEKRDDDNYCQGSPGDTGPGIRRLARRLLLGHYGFPPETG